MSIELLTKDHLSVIKNSIKNCSSEIMMVSPFIGLQTANLLSNAINSSNVECTIITRFYREDFLNHVSSLDGLKSLNTSGCRIFALKNLHTKLFLFDQEIAILGSANFTMGGLKYNHELSFLIEDDELVINLKDYFKALLSEIEQKGNYEIDNDKIETEISITDRLSKNRSNQSIKYSNNIRFGADLSSDKEAISNDIIEDAINSQTNSDFQNNIWLKFVGTGSNRYETGTRYTPVVLDSNKKITTSFPRHPRGMDIGDYIYLAALSWDKDGKATPMIMGRARTKGYYANNEINEDDSEQYPWMTNYPFYVELYDIEILDTDVGNTISFDRIIRELGPQLYPTTQGKVLTTAEIKTRHHQKSHLKITPVAKKYIDQLFDEIINNEGVNIY